MTIKLHRVGTGQNGYNILVCQSNGIQTEKITENENNSNMVSCSIDYFQTNFSNYIIYNNNFEVQNN